MPRLNVVLHKRALLLFRLLNEVLESSLFHNSQFQSESEPPLMSASSSSDSSSSSPDSSSDSFLAFFLVFSGFPFDLDLRFSFCELESVTESVIQLYNVSLVRGTIKKYLVAR